MFFLCWIIGLCFACQSKRATESSPFLQAEEVALSNPMASFSNPFFQQKTSIPLSFALKDVDLAYMLRTKEKTQTGIYESPLVLEEDFILKVVAQHTDYKNSDTLKIEGLRVDNKKSFQILQILPAADKKYSEGGKDNLQDRKKASAYVSAKGWLGFNGQNVQVDLKLDQALSDFTCILSCFVNQNAWIFAPESILVLGSADGENFVELGAIEHNDHSRQPMQFYFPKIHSHLKNCKYLRFQIQALRQLPEWHAGAGNTAWLFLDEILIE